ncbi:hypothetical protein C8A01DRAFT_15968 [Parachaetomium inaequale]|uniref:Uncharacterized protein n=1 Tax=Parachaetomium inaequale TaxID=2588326 RepID=A0AAN6SRQ4_9PEZI|nr:hypothetical protein C8A01DRAFT_15968 [Parachaetomium inaequale]
MWDAVDDPSKTREIRYGNNIYVLFRALLHCRKYYGQQSLWAAIGKGFNTSPTIARVTAEILTKARRAQRAKRCKDVPDTALAADDWIDFLDSRDSHPRMLSDPEVHKVADAFFKTQDKKHLNAARVPTNGRQPPLYISTIGRPSSRGQGDEMYSSPRGILSPSVKTESPRDSDRHRPSPFGRKRSASPPTGPSSKSMRFNHDIRQQPRPEPERHGALDALPTIQATRSPPRLSESRPAHPAQPAQQTEQAQAAQPAQPSQPVQPSQSVQPPRPTAPAWRQEDPNVAALSARAAQVVALPSPPAKREDAPTTSAQPSQAAQPVAQPTAPARREEPQEAPKAPTSPAADDTSALKARIASLEKQLAEAERKPATPTTSARSAPTSTGMPPSQLRQDMARLGNEMATVTNAVTAIMESMHDVVDGLSSGQEETSTLATEQKELKTTLLQFIHNSSNNHPNNADTLQTLANTVNALRNDIAELKSRPTQPAAAAAAAAAADQQQHNLETLLHAQNTRIDRLIREVASLQEQQQTVTHAPQHQPHAQPQHPQQPQTLRQAMAAAERDLKHHLATVQAFYHHSAGGAGVSRAVTERTADLMNLLTEGMRAARDGQAGV